MESQTSIDVLDLASSKPTHRRTPSSKSSILKALISPVKQQRRSTRSTQHDSATASSTIQTAIRDIKTSRGRFGVKQSSHDHLVVHDKPIRLQPSSESRSDLFESPGKSQKENVDPFIASEKHIALEPPKTPGQRHSLRANALMDTRTLTITTGQVQAAVAALQERITIPVKQCLETTLDAETIDAGFEAMLDARNVAPHMRDKMRNLTLRVKADLVRQEQQPTSPLKLRSSHESTDAPKDDVTIAGDRSTKRSRPLSHTFTFSRGDKLGDDSPSKKRRGRSKSRAEADSSPSGRKSSRSRAASRGGVVARTESPETYIAYLTAQSDPSKMEVGRLHKLRILLRNETVSWVDEFIALDGLSHIHRLLMDIMKIEWREQNEDQLLHETLLCLKGLCTTETAMVALERHADQLLTALVAMLFDAERKGPAEYTTRTVIINVLFSYLACKLGTSSEQLEGRARSILHYLSQKPKGEDTQPLGFVLDMRVARPYQAWAKEVSNVTKEVFWIFLHQLNVVPFERPSSSDSETNISSTFAARHFPRSRPPVPAAPYVGGVEWDATTYLTAHLDLVNGLIAALPSESTRNELRLELQLSGFEKIMGSALRTCKEKFYAGIHDGLRSWVSSASEDRWPTDFVREGPSVEEQIKTAKSSPQKSGKKQAPAPRLEEIKLECSALELDVRGLMRNDETNDGWLG